MNVDANILIKEYEQTIREMGVRLANYAVLVAQLQAQLENLKPKETKE